MSISKEISSLVQSFFAVESFSFLLAIFASSLLSYLWPSLLLIFCGTPQIIDIRMSIKVFETQSTSYVLHSTQWWKTKCWMELYSNACNIKMWLDDPENVGRKAWSRTNFTQHCPTRFLSSFFFFFKFCKISNASSISSNIENLQCWVKCWMYLRRS